MKEWIKKQLKKIQEHPFILLSQKKLKDFNKTLLLREKILLGVMVVILIDLMIALFAPSVKSDFSRLYEEAKELNGVDLNNSALTEMLKADKVYFLVDKDLNVQVLLQEGNESRIMPDIPIYSITRNIEKELIAHDINYQWIEPKEGMGGLVILGFLSQHLFEIIMIGFLFFMLQRSGMMLNGNKYTIYYPKKIKGSMEDIIGYEDIKEEIKHLVEMLKNIDLYAKYGIEEVFNIMFSGSQGTGKTTMAVQIAKKLEVPILVTTGNIETGFVGGGANVIKSIYAKAKSLAQENRHRSCIVFIDEAQNLLMKRGVSRERWADDSPNELLTHLEGVKSTNEVHIITIVASNFDESNMQLDEAMAARFKKKIHFRLPNEEERKALIIHFLKKVEERSENIGVEHLAKVFSGTSPRTIATIIQEASLLALAKGEQVNQEHLMKAFEVVMIGQSNRKTTQNREKERRIIAVHEIGHFMVDFKQTFDGLNGDWLKTKAKMKIIKISSENISRANALGYVLHESEDILLRSIHELEKEVRILYGGVAAEELIFGKEHTTTGATNDIEKVTKILHHLFIESGAYSQSKLKLDELDPLKKEAYQAMHQKAQELYHETLTLLAQEEQRILYLAEALMKQWVLSKEEIFDLLEAYNEQKSTNTCINE